MAKKTFIGKVVSDKMMNAVVVEIGRQIKHPIYKKTVKRTSRIKAAVEGKQASIGQYVKIEQTRPISHSVHFKVIEVIAENKKGETA